MSSLPILRLPHLALIEVLKCWNPFELFAFAQCSRKAARVIPLAGTRNFVLNFECPSRIYINEEYIVDIKKIGEKVLYYGPTMDYRCRTMDRQVTVETRSVNSKHTYYLTSQWSDVWIGFQTFGLHLSELFKCPVTFTSYSDSISMEQFLGFGEEIVQKQITIKKISIGRRQQFMNPKAFLDGVSMLNGTEALHLEAFEVQPESSFEYNFANVPKCFSLTFARWFTRTHLLSFENCKLINVHCTSLVHEDVDEFVNLWKSGEFSGLEYFEIGMDFQRNFERNSPIGGLSNLKNYSNRMRRIKKIYSYTVNVLEGAVVQGDDGRKADVRLNFPYSQFQLLVHSKKDTLEYVELITIH